MGFSKEHRDLNILRIGYVASEITKAGGVAICAPIAPYRDAAQSAGNGRGFTAASSKSTSPRRSRFASNATARDYAKARKGLIKEFTGIDDPYEIPEKPEMVIDTKELSAELSAHRILIKLESTGINS